MKKAIMTFQLLPNDAITFTNSVHGNEVLENLLQQREGGRWCDVILHVAEQEYNAHRCVLSACSPFFHSIFKAGKTVKEQLNICSEKPEVFPNLLNYMYTGSVLIDATNVSELLKLADKLLLFKLKDYCAEYLERYLDENNCLTVFDMAKRFKLENLFCATENIIACNLDQIIGTKEIQESHQAKLEALISNPSLKFTNEQKLLLIANWVMARPSERQSAFSVLLTWIDWLSLDTSLVCCLIQGHELFSDENALCTIMEALNDKNLLPKELLPKFSDIKSKTCAVDYTMDNDNFMNYAISTAIDELQEGLTHLDTMKPTYVPLPSQSAMDISHKAIPRPRKSLTNVHEVLQANLGSDAQMEDIYERDVLIDYRCANLYDDHLDTKARSVNQIDCDPRRPGDAHENLSFSYPKNHQDCHQPPMKAFTDILNDSPKNRYYSVSYSGQRPNMYADDDWRDDDRSQPFDLSYEGNLPCNPSYGIVQSREECSGFNAQVALSNEDLAQAFQNIATSCSPRHNQVAEVNTANQYQDSCIDFRNYNEDGSAIFASPPKERNLRIESMDLVEDPQHSYSSFSKVKKIQNISDRNVSIETSQTLHEIPDCRTEDKLSFNNSETGECSPSEHIPREDPINDVPTKAVRLQIRKTLRPKATKRQRTSEGVSNNKTKEIKSCDICSREFSSTKEYYTHMKDHFPGPKFNCDTCDSSFNRIYGLIGHRVLHSADKKYQCKLCPFKSHREFNLREHVSIHTNTRPYACDICEARFSRNQFLVNHLKTHSGEKDFQCSVCDWRGRTQNLLRTHAKAHSGDLLKCSYEGCVYKTAKKSHMKDHMSSHSKSETFICDICNAGFSVKTRLLRHARKHRIDSLICCSFCDYSCNRTDGLRRHVNFKHKDRQGNATSQTKNTLGGHFAEFSSSSFCLPATDDPDGNLVIVSELEEEPMGP